MWWFEWEWYLDICFPGGRSVWEGLGGGYLGVDLEVSKTPTRLSLSLSASCLWVRRELSATVPMPCLPAAGLPAIMAMDSPS